MLSESFNRGLEKLKTTFGNNPFDAQRSVLIWRAVESLTDNEFEKIVNFMIGSFRQAPLPKDFFEAARAERSRRVREQHEEPYIVQCHDCQDTGYRFITADDGQATWCYCNCTEGGVQVELRKAALPIWDINMRQTCKVRPFPIKAFKPKTPIDPQDLSRSLMERVEAWKKELKDAEKYWLSRINNLSEGA